MTKIKTSSKIFLLSLLSNILTNTLYIILNSIISNNPMIGSNFIKIFSGVIITILILAIILKIYSKPLDNIQRKIEDDIQLTDKEKGIINNKQFGFFILYPIFFVILFIPSYFIIAFIINGNLNFFTDIGLLNFYFFSLFLGLISTILQIYLFNIILNKLKNKAGITKLYNKDKKLTITGKLIFILFTITLLTGITISYNWQESFNIERRVIKQNIVNEAKKELKKHMNDIYNISLDDSELNSILKNSENLNLPNKAVIHRIIITSLILSSIFGILACVLAWIFSTDFKFQLRLLKSKIEKMLGKEPQEYQRLTVTSVDELGVIVSDFNRLIDYHKNIADEFKRIDELKNDFLTNISQELKTPLNGIIGIAESLSDGIAGKLNLNAVNNLKIITAVGKRLSKLIDDVLDFSKIRKGEIILNKKPVKIYPIVSSLLSMFRYLIKGKDIKLINEVNENLPMILTDENRFQQIIYNLLGNAVKFTEKGFIKISADIIYINNKKMINIKIEDTGIGMPKERINNIFHSYQQVSEEITKTYGGTGIGLYIVKKLVELNDGMIHVESELGKGSTFVLILPIAYKNQQIIDSETSLINNEEDINYVGMNNIQQREYIRKEEKIDTIRVMVVDDEPINQQVLENQLGLEGYEIIKALDAIEALEILDKHKPDIVLLDVMMPKMSGFELNRRIREKYSPSELPIIMLTVKNRETDIIQGFASGANDYITKPFSKKELLARINVHINLTKMTQAYKTSEMKIRKLNEELEQKVQKRTEELEYAYKELESFSYRVSHDLKNPISIIEQVLSLIYSKESDILNNERIANYFKFIDKNTKKMKTIIDSLLILSKVAVSKINIKRVNLTEIVKQLSQDIKVANPDKDIRFTIAPDVYCDADKQLMMIALENLIDNAFKYSYKNESQILIDFGTKHEKDRIVYFIKDNGTGFDMNECENLFEPFKRLHLSKDYEGSGIGLSTVKRILEKHNGEIWAESKIGVGSTFYFTIKHN